jgi:hypothetical protein
VAGAIIQDLPGYNTRCRTSDESFIKRPASHTLALGLLFIADEFAECKGFLSGKWESSWFDHEKSMLNWLPKQ